MATPGFPAGTLDGAGFPAWITGLASEHTIGTAHVVRDLPPGDALRVLGAEPDLIATCRLPAERPSEWVSLVAGAVGPTDSTCLLLAGQIGAWTFVYDDLGLTAGVEDAASPGGFAPSAKMLSVGSREAATSTFTINADTSLAYAADGRLLLHAGESVDPAEDDIPAGLWPAIEAAGHVESEGDEGINMRVLAALAGLAITVDDLREIPLLAVPFG